MTPQDLAQKLSWARIAVLQKFPFFGRLLLKLRYGTAECGTAYTDMQRIVFDPAFAQRLSDEETQYVLVHEVLHCALKHCSRSAGKQPFIYNVACDIVVNSVMLSMYQREEIFVDGEALMHLTPYGQEGRDYTAEEIYRMLMKMSPNSFQSQYGSGQMDNHDVWGHLNNTSLEDLWDRHLKEAVAACGIASGIPNYLSRYLREIDRSPRTNWRQVLHDFIQYDSGDYSFTRPDKRYTGDFILPSFCDSTDSKVEKLWFLVDTSGSVSDEAVSTAYYEIQQALAQIDNVSGMLSFFDYTVSDPAPFENMEDLLAIKPIGGGGTNFHAIFRKLEDYANEGDFPNAMVIITDGHASFPDEEAALGVPVIWIIVDSDVTPPWGAYAFIST